MRVRLTFTKGEPVRYIGHLDLHRALERIFRRARVPLAYSQGFNPRPRLNLASALPLGVTGRAELAEAWLEEEMPLEVLKVALNGSAAPGIQITELEPVPDKTPKLPNLIEAAGYRVALDEVPPGLTNAVRDLLAADRIQRTRKGKTYDLRPLVEALSLENGSDGSGLLIRLAARPGATGRVDEVLLALGISLEKARAERVALYLTEQS